MNVKLMNSYVVSQNMENARIGMEHLPVIVIKASKIEMDSTVNALIKMNVLILIVDLIIHVPILLEVTNANVEKVMSINLNGNLVKI